MSVGAFCHIKQDVRSGHSAHGAQIALEMVEYERERKLEHTNLLISSFMSLFCR